MLHRDMIHLKEIKNLQIGIKYGFIGLGMGGGSIAAACADIETNITNNKYPYTGLLINTNTNDYAKIKTKNEHIHKIGLAGYEMGAGRDIEIGQEAFLTNQDNVKENINKYMSDRDFIWIVAGLGGGTGTGSILACVNLLFELGYGDKIGLILTLPSDSEGYNVISNALKRLQKIYEVQEHLGAIILVDNQKLHKEFIEQEPTKSADDYLKFSNLYIAHTLHAMNIITSSLEHIGAQYFDQSELLKMLKTSGVLSISKISYEENQFDVLNQASYLPQFKEGFEKGILSSGYDVQQADLASVNFIANEKSANRIYSRELDSVITNTLNEYLPTAGEKPLSKFINKGSTGKVEVYILLAGLELPERAIELIEEKNRIEKERENQKNTPNKMKEVFSSLTFESDEPKKEKKSSLFDLNSNSEPNTKESNKKKPPINIFGD